MENESCSSSLPDYSQAPRRDSRYCEGATPMRRLKVRVKWHWSQKPAARAIWTIGVSDAASSRQANSIRICFNDTPTTEIYTLSLPDALTISATRSSFELITTF